MIKIFKPLFFTVLFFLVVSFSVLGQSEKNDFAEAYKVKNDHFVLQFTSQGISSLQKTADIYPTDYVQKDKVFGQLLLRYSYADGSLDSLKTSLQKRFLTVLKKGEENQVRYAVNNDTSGIKLVETYTLTEDPSILIYFLEKFKISPRKFLMIRELVGYSSVILKIIVACTEWPGSYS